VPRHILLGAFGTGEKLLNTNEIKNKKQLFAVFSKKHKQATAFSLIAVVLTIVFFYGFVTKVTIPLWGNTISYVAIFIFFVNWYSTTKAQDAFKSTKGMRDYNPRSRIETTLNSFIIQNGENTTFGILDDGITAFTGGINKSIVVFSEKLLGALNTHQAVAVALHELGHQKNNDLPLLLVGVTIQSAVKTASRMALFLAVWYGVIAIFTKGPAAVTMYNGSSLPVYRLYLDVWLITKAAQVFISVLVNFASRQREIMADSFAVINGYGEELVEALVIITAMLHPKQKKLHTGLYWQFVNLFENHPLLVTRVKTIRFLMNGSEGLIEDTLEFWLITAALGVVWFLGISHILPNDQLSVFGLPALYLVGPLFIGLVYQLVTHPFTIDSPNTADANPAVILVVGFIVMAILALLGGATLLLTAKQLGVGYWPVGGLAAALVGFGLVKKTALTKLLLTASAIATILFVAAGIASLFFVL